MKISEFVAIALEPPKSLIKGMGRHYIITTLVFILFLALPLVVQYTNISKLTSFRKSYTWKCIKQALIGVGIFTLALLAVAYCVTIKNRVRKREQELPNDEKKQSNVYDNKSGK